MLQNLISFYFFYQELSLGTKNHFAYIEEKIDNFNPLYFRQVYLPYNEPDGVKI
jgi:hypothetical protein